MKKCGFHMIRPSNPPKKTELFSTSFYSKYHFLQYFLKIMTFYFIFSGIGGVRWWSVVKMHTPYAVVFFMLNDLRWVVFVHFFYICGIVVHHCFNFPFINDYDDLSASWPTRDEINRSMISSRLPTIHIGSGLWSLIPLSTMHQLYRGGKFY